MNRVGLPRTGAAGGEVGDLLHLVAHLDDPVIVLDAGGACLFTNRCFEELVGGAGTPAQGECDAWIEPASRRRWAAMLDIVRTRTGADLGQLTTEVEFATASGPRATDVTWSSVHSEAGELRAVLVIARPRDLTAPEPDEATLVETLRRLEEELPQPFETGAPDAPGRRENRHDPRLTGRENDVAGSLLDGVRPAEIASALFLSEHTVRNHVKRIYRKLGVHSLAELRAALRGE